MAKRTFPRGGRHAQSQKDRAGHLPDNRKTRGRVPPRHRQRTGAAHRHGLRQSRSQKDGLRADFPPRHGGQHPPSPRPQRRQQVLRRSHGGRGGSARAGGSAVKCAAARRGGSHRPETSSPQTPREMVLIAHAPRRGRGGVLPSPGRHRPRRQNGAGAALSRAHRGQRASRRRQVPPDVRGRRHKRRALAVHLPGEHDERLRRDHRLPASRDRKLPRDLHRAFREAPPAFLCESVQRGPRKHQSGGLPSAARRGHARAPANLPKENGRLFLRHIPLRLADKAKSGGLPLRAL